jgi:hypothetical protein
MAETLSLMEFLQALLADAGLRGDFGDDPQGTLAAHGLAGLTPADVHDALVLVQDNQTVDYSLDAATPPPPPPAADDHEAAVQYLARYLDDPRQAGPDEQWVDPDADVAWAAAPPDAPIAAFGACDDTGYGAGAGLSATEVRTVPSETVEPDPEPGIGGHDDRDSQDDQDDQDLDGFDDLHGFDGLPGAHLDDGPDEPGQDSHGAAAPEGAW